jgi:hypothetical protein
VGSFDLSERETLDECVGYTCDNAIGKSGYDGVTACTKRVKYGTTKIQCPTGYFCPDQRNFEIQFLCPAGYHCAAGITSEAEMTGRRLLSGASPAIGASDVLAIAGTEGVAEGLQLQSQSFADSSSSGAPDGRARDPGVELRAEEAPGTTEAAAPPTSRHRLSSEESAAPPTAGGAGQASFASAAMSESDETSTEDDPTTEEISTTWPFSPPQMLRLSIFLNSFMRRLL